MTRLSPKWHRPYQPYINPTVINNFALKSHFRNNGAVSAVEWEMGVAYVGCPFCPTDGMESVETLFALRCAAPPSVFPSAGGVLTGR